MHLASRLVKMTAEVQNRASEWGRSDLSVFERGMVVGARRVGLIILKNC